jgi:hypothetical protein
LMRTVIRADSDPARQTLVRAPDGVEAAHPDGVSGARAPGRDASVGARHLAVRRGRLRCAWPPASVVHRPCPGRGQSGERAASRLREVIGWVGAADCAWLRTGTKANRCGGLRRAGRARAAGPGPGDATGDPRRRPSPTASWWPAGWRRQIAWYARSLAILRRHRPGAVLVSSEANPDEAGFLGAARVLAIPQIYASHAYPTPFSPPLDFTLSILEGEAAVQGHRRHGPITGRILQVGTRRRVRTNGCRPVGASVPFGRHFPPEGILVGHSGGHRRRLPARTSMPGRSSSVASQHARTATLERGDSRPRGHHRVAARGVAVRRGASV